MATNSEQQHAPDSEFGVIAASAPAVPNRRFPDHFAALAETVPVKFIELRSSMCRWPIGDPQNFEIRPVLRFSLPGYASYCETHTAIAHASSRPLKPRITRYY